MDSVEEKYPIGGFTTVHISSRLNGEVDPNFIKVHGKTVGSKWKFVRPDGQYKMVDFEGWCVYPVLTTGWSDLREFYKLKLENETMHIGYYGENVFELIATEWKDNPEEYPTFHSRCTNKSTTICFDLKLNYLSVQKSKLRLTGRLEDYVRGHGMEQVRLCTDNRIVMHFNVYSKGSPGGSTKIGDGWKDFCLCNHFNEGDKIRFRYVYAARQSIFRVFKV